MRQPTIFKDNTQLYIAYIYVYVLKSWRTVIVGYTIDGENGLFACWHLQGIARFIHQLILAHKATESYIVIKVMSSWVISVKMKGIKSYYAYNNTYDIYIYICIIEIVIKYPMRTWSTLSSRASECTDSGLSSEAAKGCKLSLISWRTRAWLPSLTTSDPFQLVTTPPPTPRLL